jgi:hypothetical protein
MTPASSARALVLALLGGIAAWACIAAAVL